MEATGGLTNPMREPELDVMVEELKRKESPSSMVEILDDDSHAWKHLERTLMRTKQFLRIAGTAAAIVILAVGGMLMRSANAQSKHGDDGESRIQQGFSISPVPLNLAGKNRALVGHGSYLVNGPAMCAACHNPGPNNASWLPGGNPFFGQPLQINPATFMSGGRNLGTLGSTNIIARNLTPDGTGLPAGLTFAEFLLIMRTGVDRDQVHPPCSGTPEPGCVPPPNDGRLLQTMPWPYYQNMTDHDLQAIYEYLSAIPCVAGPPAPSLLHHDCD